MNRPNFWSDMLVILVLLKTGTELMGQVPNWPPAQLISSSVIIFFIIAAAIFLALRSTFVPELFRSLISLGAIILFMSQLYRESGAAFSLFLILTALIWLVYRLVRHFPGFN